MKRAGRILMAAMLAAVMLVMTACGASVNYDNGVITLTADDGQSVDQAAAAVVEPTLDYWSEGSKPADSIREFVAQVTDENSDKFVPEEDRIAVFDLDGTIIGELCPTNFETMMLIHRALHDSSYKAPADMKEYAGAVEKGIYTGEMPDNHWDLYATYIGEAYAGMTPEELRSYTQEFMKTEADGFTNLTKGEAFYKPMVSLVEYLTANDFQVYVVSGSDRNLVRGIIKDKLPVPENRVIGKSYTMKATGQGDTDGLDYVYSAEDDVIIGSDVIVETIKMNKVSAIALEIGKTPILSFGNSSGDVSMAQYVENNKRYEGRAYMVLCDDTIREHGNPEEADSMRKTCEERGFETISMWDDFATIYGDDVEAVSYSGDDELEDDAA